MTENQYMYVFVSQQLSHPQQIVQASHASACIGAKYGGDTYIVLCGAESEVGLIAIAEYLDGKKIDYHMYYEPDISSYTALATLPLAGADRRHLKKFKLLN